jgi:hypothetical protein
MASVPSFADVFSFSFCFFSVKQVFLKVKIKEYL